MWTILSRSMQVKREGEYRAQLKREAEPRRASVLRETSLLVGKRLEGKEVMKRYSREPGGWGSGHSVNKCMKHSLNLARTPY